VRNLRIPRRAVPEGGPGVIGLARVDRRTKNLTKRLEPGDIAIIDHADIDVVAAQALVAKRPAAVVNAAQSISGRYPNLGPEIIVHAGIPLIDDVGPDVLTAVQDGTPVRVHEAAVWIGDRVVAKGVELETEQVAAAVESARAGLAVQIESFAANTLDFLRRERALLLDRVGVPEIASQIDGRHVLIVVRGHQYKEDLAILRPYIREYRPALVGVDGGADAILEAGYRPDMILGDMDSVSDRALTCGAEIVVHAYRDGRAPGLARVHELGLEPVVFPAAGTSEDVALLLADDKGAELIVVVGIHNGLVDFLDKGRAGMASSFLTQLRVSDKVVNAKGVSRLYRQRIGTLQVVLLAIAGLVALAAAMAVTKGGQTAYALIGARIDEIVSWVAGFFTEPRPEAFAPRVRWPLS
jgi:uncharacterized membrane-anchored protein